MAKKRIRNPGMKVCEKVRERMCGMWEKGQRKGMHICKYVKTRLERGHLMCVGGEEFDSLL